MTTYLLHGGQTHTRSATNRAFYSLMASRVPPGGTWLGCYFANFTEKQDAKFQLDKSRLQRVARHKFTITMATQEDFASQVQSADVLYFAGGSTHGLMNNLKNWPQITHWLQSAKVVAGSSAGMNMLGREYLAKDGSKGHGLGIIPYGMLVHHTAPAYTPGHLANPLQPPVIALHETQFCQLEL